MAGPAVITVSADTKRIIRALDYLAEIEARSWHAGNYVTKAKESLTLSDLYETRQSKGADTRSEVKILFVPSKKLNDIIQEALTISEEMK